MRSSRRTERYGRFSPPATRRDASPQSSVSATAANTANPTGLLSRRKNGGPDVRECGAAAKFNGVKKPLDLVPRLFGIRRESALRLLFLFRGFFGCFFCRRFL